jgi:hypothetical protein
MNIKLREAETVLSKLRFQPLGQKHLSIRGFFYENRLLLKTRFSRGKGDMPGKVADKFRTQLKLNETQLREAIRCPFGYEEYVALLKEKGIIH